MIIEIIELLTNYANEHGLELNNKDKFEYYTLKSN